MRDFLGRNWFPALLALFFSGPVIFWSLDHDPPVEIIAITAPEPNVRRGGNLILNYDVIRRRHCQGEVQRIISDAQDSVHLIEPYRFNSGFGKEGRQLSLGPERYPVSAPVPFGAAPGPADFQAVVEYWCNPLQRFFRRGIVVIFPVVKFTILSDEADKVEPPRRIPGAERLPPSESLNIAPSKIIRRVLP